MFTKNQTVRIAAYPFGGGVDWSEKGRIVRPDTALKDWYIVRFDRGGRLCVNASRLMADNES